MLTLHTSMKKINKLVHPCRCPKCENSCNYGSGALINDDLKRLAEHLELSEKEVKEKYLEEIKKFNTILFRPKLLREDNKPYGKCVFYDDVNGCSVHEAKPTECKIAMGCKDYGEELITWFDLNNFFNKDDPESVRQYIIYLESGGKSLPGAELDRIDEEIMKQAESYEDLKDEKDWDSVLGLKEDDDNGK